MAFCEQCGKEHDGSFGSGRFCCRSCSNKWVALHQSDEAKARKIEKGSSNLNRGGWRLTEDQRREASIKGGYARSTNIRNKKKVMLDEALVTGVFPDWYSIGRLLKYDLVDLGYLSYECYECGNTGFWNGKVLTLHLHHKDGKPGNNKLTNLGFLCPNCHSQTSNYSWRNVPRNTGD